jgi:drug/metabolite transporter (DMT)-like permease
MISKSIKAHLALFGANLIYGINYTVAKDVMPQYLLPSGFVVIRVIGASLLFWALGGIYSHEKIEKSDWTRLFLCAVFGVAVNQLFFFEGLSRTSPINAGILMVVTPILVLVISNIILREKITLLKIAGITTGISGALILLLSKGKGSFGSDTFLGDIFIFLNAASYAIYLVIVKPLMFKYQSVTIMKWVFLLGLLIVLPFGFKEFSSISWSTIPSIIYYEIIYVIVFTTFFAYLLNTYGLQYMNPTVVSIYIYLQPLLAALIAVILGKDSLDFSKVISALFIFTGVYLVSYIPNKKQHV